MDETHCFKLNAEHNAHKIAYAAGNICIEQNGDFCKIIIHDGWDEPQTREQLAEKLKAAGLID